MLEVLRRIGVRQLAYGMGKLEGQFEILMKAGAVTLCEGKKPVGTASSIQYKDPWKEHGATHYKNKRGAQCSPVFMSRP